MRLHAGTTALRSRPLRLPAVEAPAADEPAAEEPAAEAPAVEAPAADEPAAEEPAAEAPAAEESTTEEPFSVTIGLSAELEILNPLKHTDATTSSVMHGTVYETLVRLDGLDGSPVPGLALSWEPVEERVWEITLREGVEFSNGEPFNAEAAAASLAYTLDEANEVPSGFFLRRSITEIEVVDDATIRLHTQNPDPLVATALSQTQIVPPGVLATDPDSLDDAPVGTGPMLLVEWTRGERIVFEPNPNYWGGRVAIDELIFRPIPDDSARVASLIAGEIDLAANIPPELVQVIDNNDGTSVIGRSVRMIYLGLDQLGINNEALGDVRVRQALNYAVDKQAVVDNILLGYGKVNNAGFYEITPGYDETLEPYPYDPDKARELLAEAGYADGFDLELAASAGLEGALKIREIAEFYAGAFEDVGVNTRIRFIEPAEFGDIYRSATLEAYFFGSGCCPESGFIVPFLLQSDIRGYYYQSPETDAIIRPYNSTLDADEREAAGNVLHRHVSEEAPWVFMHEQQGLFGVSDRIDWRGGQDRLFHADEIFPAG